MDVDILYGKTGLRVSLPASARVTVIEKPEMPLLNDPRAAVASALDDGEESLASLAAGARSACILICDVTRPVPNGVFLGPIIDRLIGAGVPAEGITILVATGLHRPNEDDELAEVVGDPSVLRRVTVANHFARNDADHVLVGTTTKGTVVRLDRRFVEADVKISTGLVEPHFMAGYSGGRKVITPGVAHAETITTLHNHRFMANPKASSGVLDGNPLHEEQLEVVEMLGGALALNTVIDDRRRLAFLNFGEILSTHLDAVAFVRRYAEVAVPEHFRTVLTGAAGYPLDRTFYQTVKGMVGAAGILEDGGDLIIASECSEGLGSPEYVAAQRRYIELGPSGFLDEIAQKSHSDIDAWQTHMQTRPQVRVGISLYSSGLSADDEALTGVTAIRSVETAIRESLERHGDNRIAVIPEGPYVVPYVDAG